MIIFVVNVNDTTLGPVLNCAKQAYSFCVAYREPYVGVLVVFFFLWYKKKWSNPKSSRIFINPVLCIVLGTPVVGLLGVWTPGWGIYICRDLIREESVQLFVFFTQQTSPGHKDPLSR